MSKPLWLVISAVLNIATMASYAQQPNEPAITQELSVPSEGKRLMQWSTGLFGAIECDATGGIYVRDANIDNPQQSPVLRLSSESTTRYELSKAVDLPGDSAAMAFTVDPAGNVFVLAIAEEKPRESKSRDVLFLVSFNSDGDFKEIRRFPEFFTPAQILSLPSGDFLITGTKRARDVKSRPAAVIGIFDDRGVEKLSLSTSWDQQQSVNNDKSPGLRNPGIQFGRLRLGSDGTIYLFRPVSQPVVDIYSASGKFIHHWELQPPLSGLQPFEMFISNDKIIVSFQKAYPMVGNKPSIPKEPDTRLFHAVYRAQDGELLHTYIQNSPGILACVRDGEATFLGTTRDRHFQIMTASIR